jgi:hypothetical protein
MIKWGSFKVPVKAEHQNDYNFFSEAVNHLLSDTLRSDACSEVNKPRLVKVKTQ